MTAVSAQSVQPSGSFRRLIGGHPVTAMLLLMFIIGWAFLIPAAIAGVPLIPIPMLGAIFLAQLGPAVLVIWASGGWPAVRELFSRVFRWRVHPAWYVLAVLAIPVVSLLWTAAVFGGGAVQALFTKPSVIEDYLVALTILPIVSLWEEMAWMGVVQARLATYRGPLLAAVITGPLFGLLHMPLNIGRPIGAFLFAVAIAMVFGIVFRIFLGWIYYATGGSILLVAITHTTFDAANNTQLLMGAGPSQVVLQPGGGAVHAVVLVFAILVLVATRGRLAGKQAVPQPGP